MKSNLYIFGEVLFDHFADGSKVLGGAPFNVAWHLQAFGQSPVFISRIGQDAEGETIRGAMQTWGMDTSALQLDTQLPTGKVTIQINNNEPEYDIVSPCAYDEIQIHDLPELQASNLLYHGSLALRHEHSRAALQHLISRKPKTVLVDVNLRAPWWSKADILQLIRNADWVKLNSDELDALYPSKLALTERLSQLIELNRLQGVILTRGSAGAELVTATRSVYHVEPETGINVVDTVGAGDALTAVVILGLSNNWPLQTTLQRAQSFASSIVEQRGATVSQRDFYQPFINSWKL